MGRKPNFAMQAANMLSVLALNFKEQTLGQHITLAFSDYSKIDTLTDKEFYEGLKEYKAAKELDKEIEHSNDIQQIIDEAKDLDALLRGIVESGEEEDY